MAACTHSSETFLIQGILIMAGASLLTLIDDIAVLLDDIAVMSKVAVKKTAGVLGDDLAVNAEQVSGVRANRELPVVWAVAKGSFKNKFIIVPAVLLVSAFLPWLITPVLMIGGAYLCFEGAEKVLHMLLHRSDENHPGKTNLSASEEDIAVLEKQKVEGAIRTDFILSLEIIVIALGSVQGVPFVKQCLVISVVALGITVGVYGLVAIIVKIDDFGLYLTRLKGLFVKVGVFLLWFAPALMKFLSVAGTLAMFLVGGGIISHGLHGIIHKIHSGLFGYIEPNSLSETLLNTASNALVGLIVGLAVVSLLSFFQRVSAAWSAGKEG